SKFGRTIKYPHDKRSLRLFGESSLEQLFCFKNYVLTVAAQLKDNLQKDDSNFGSQSTHEDQDFIKKCYNIADKALKWPLIPDDFFKIK
ncbi:hypothetical protein BDB01DRAFT_725654, partial [Pilobolus umbonatus]